MNKRNRKLILLGDDLLEKPKMTSYSNTTGASYKTYKFNSNAASTTVDPQQVEVMVKDDPNKMEGI